MRKKYVRIFTLILFMFLAVVGTNQKKVSAATKVLKSGTVTLESVWGDKYINFSMPSSGYAVVDLNVSMGEFTYSSREEITMSVSSENYDEDGFYDDDTEGVFSFFDDCVFDNFPKGEKGDLGLYWYCTDEKIPSGRYTLYIENSGAHDLKIKYTISYHSSLASSIKVVNPKITIEADKKAEIKLSKSPSSDRLLFHDIVVDKTSIADAYWNNEKVYVEGLKAGTCTLKIVLWNDYTETVTVTVKNPSKPRLQYTSAKLWKGESLKNKLKYTNKKVTWSSSNKKVATVNSKGKITAKGVGKCTITAKVGKSKYKCNIKVIYQDPNFYAQVRSYNTRDNYFTVKFYNASNKSVVINSGMKVINDDYKTFDRNVYLKKSVTIKPKKKATVRFYVKGRTTWYNYKDYTLYYNFTFDGKKYEGHVWYDDGSFKKGNKWYTTYWDGGTKFAKEINW